MFEISETNDIIMTKIKIVGIGGAGGNAINTMIDGNLEDVEFIAMNTDVQDLKKSKASNRVQLGIKLTDGRGAGGKPEIGAKAAEESYDDIKNAISGSDFVFIIAGMGGGTGTGAAPLVAKAARELDILTMAIVTRPFQYELNIRNQNAEEGIRNLKKFIDTIVIIPNNKIFKMYSTNTVVAAFNESNNIMSKWVSSLSNIITKTGYINLEFSDIKTITSNMGNAIIGTGEADGEDRAINAAQNAINNPLLEDMNIETCKAMMIYISCGPDIGVLEMENVYNTITNEVAQDVTCITGFTIDNDMEGVIRVVVIVTGVNEEDEIIEEKPFESKVPERQRNYHNEGHERRKHVIDFDINQNDRKDDSTLDDNDDDDDDLPHDIPPFMRALD